MTDLRTPLDPYELITAPTSSGRVLLSRALTHYCLLHWGINEEDITLALAGSGDDVETVRGAVALLGRVLADGGMRAHARPFGGGPSVPLEAEHWEVDDHRPRFASSALNLRNPWDHSAEPTHWVFLDGSDFDAIVEASCADVPRPRRRGDLPANAAAASQATAADGPEQSTGEHGRKAAGADALRLVRMPEVRSRTGLARSTIYKKVGNGTFPKPVTTGSFLAWREAAIDDWLVSPR